MPAATIQGASDHGARNSAASASGATSWARSSPQSAIGTGPIGATSPNSATPSRPPIATPKVMVRKTTSAEAKRAVPDDRCRVASSVSATVRVKPGIR